MFDKIMHRLEWAEPPKSEQQAPPVIKRILYEPYPCEDCGKILEEKRTVDYRKTLKGWHIRCANCSCYRNPITGEFNQSLAENNAILAQQKRDRNK